jgi:hypothetical protein
MAISYSDEGFTFSNAVVFVGGSIIGNSAKETKRF